MLMEACQVSATAVAEHHAGDACVAGANCIWAASRTGWYGHSISSVQVRVCSPPPPARPRAPGSPTTPTQLPEHVDCSLGSCACVAADDVTFTAAVLEHPATGSSLHCAQLLKPAIAVCATARLPAVVTYTDVLSDLHRTESRYAAMSFGGHALFSCVAQRLVDRPAVLPPGHCGDIHQHNACRAESSNCANHTVQLLHGLTAASLQQTDLATSKGSCNMPQHTHT